MNNNNNIVFKDDQLYIIKNKIEDKIIYETKYYKLDEFNIDHGYFSSHDLNFSMKNFDKKVFEKYINKNLDFVNLLSFEHGNKIIKAKEINNYKIKEVADGIYTDKKIPLITTSADCISYIIYEKEKNILYNIHSGWRGVYSRIVINATYDLLSNGSKKENIFVFSFPAINKCHFVVKSDVYNLFENLFDNIINKYSDSKINTIKEKLKIIKLKKDELISNNTIDLVGFNTIELDMLGVNVFDSKLCTLCKNEIFNSYRLKDENKNLLYCKLN